MSEQAGGELSEEDLATLDGIWRSSSGEAVTTPTLSDLAPPRNPSAVDTGSGELTSADLEAAKKALDADGKTGIFSWRAATPEQIAEQWGALREFVDWIVVVHRLTGSEHHPCWWRHPRMVQEWVGLRHLYDLSWSEEDAGSGPNNFHYWLQAGRARIQLAWADTRCSRREHIEPDAVLEPTVIDEQEWLALTGMEDPYETPRQWPTWGLNEGPDAHPGSTRTAR